MKNHFYISILVAAIALHSCGISIQKDEPEVTLENVDSILKALEKANSEKSRGVDSANKVLCAYVIGNEVDTAAVDSALANGADINCWCHYSGTTEKMGARIPVVRRFIRNKHKAVSTTQYPLETAVVYTKYEKVAYLLRKGADPNATAIEKSKPLFRALEHAYFGGEVRDENYRIAKLLQSYGGNLKGQYIPYDHDAEQMQLFAEFGADFNLKIGSDHTPLQSAAHFKNAEVMKVLLDNGADPNTIDTDGQTPLHCMARKESGLECIDLLLKAGADPYIMDESGSEPILIAALSSEEAFQYLLKRIDLKKSNHDMEELQEYIIERKKREQDRERRRRNRL